MSGYEQKACGGSSKQWGHLEKLHKTEANKNICLKASERHKNI